MRIWLVTIGEPLPIDVGTSRLLRAGTIATMMAARGHDVVWWTSTFDHVRKQHRVLSDATVVSACGIQIKMMYGCGYNRNVSPRRFIDHAILARKFERQATELAKPDLVVCSLPPLGLAAAVTRYGKDHNVPVIVDVRDLWPDVFLEIVPRWARPLCKMALAPLYRQARSVCRSSSAISGNSPGFVEWGLRHANRPSKIWDRYFPFGYVTPVLTAHERQGAIDLWRSYGLMDDDTNFTICFFGAFGNQFDLETVIDVALMFEAKESGVRFVLCGTGEQFESLKARACGSRAVIFPGWVGRAEIWTLMELSDMGIAPYINHVGFIGNLPNKPIEYMAGGLPVVSGLNGFLAELLDANMCGVTYDLNDAADLHNVISKLISDREKLKSMSLNARQLYVDKFDAEVVYGEMISYFQDVAIEYHERGEI